MMKSKKHFFRGTVLLAAALLTTAVPAQTWLGTSLTVSADEEYTVGKSGDLNYYKYSDHIVISGCTWEASDFTIPATIDGLPVTEIGIYACQYAKIKTLTLPDTITYIGPYAFTNCDQLQSVTFPDSLEQIAFESFRDCKSLTEVNFPDHLVKTGDYNFDNSPWLEAQRKKDPLVIVNGAVIDGRTCSGDVKVPSGVKYVASGAFAKNDKITSVSFPASVTEITDNVFWYCDNLKSAELNGCTSLGFGVFAACNKLTDIKLSGNLKKIDSYAFTDNNSTATITFYGSQSAWNAVEKDSADPFLSRAKMVFDESHVIPQDEVIGDINADGACNDADAAMLLKYLLTTGSLTEDQAKIADMDKDNELTSADLSLLKKQALAK